MATDSTEQPSTNEIRAYAVRLLGRREYARTELKARLQRKWPEAADLDELVDGLADEGLVSDQRYAESFVRSRVRRSQGPLKIRAALREKGVAAGVIDEALTEFETQWSELALDWLRRRHRGPLDFKERGRYYRRLINRGYSHDQAMDAVNAL